MKRNVMLILIVLLAVVLSACSSNNESSSSNTPTPASNTTTTTTSEVTPEPEEKIEDEVESSPAATDTEGTDEDALYNLVLVDSGDNKLEVVKVIRNETNRGLVESKDLVDTVPSTIAEQLTSEEAEALKAKFDETGATLELQKAEKKVSTGIKVVLVASGDNALDVVKVIRNETDRDLSGAKEVVDNIPSTIAEDITEEEAEALKAALEDVGATVEIQK